MILALQIVGGTLLIILIAIILISLADVCERGIPWLFTRPLGTSKLYKIFPLDPRIKNLIDLIRNHRLWQYHGEMCISYDKINLYYSELNGIKIQGFWNRFFVFHNIYRTIKKNEKLRLQKQNEENLTKLNHELNKIKPINGSIEEFLVYLKKNHPDLLNGIDLKNKEFLRGFVEYLKKEIK